MHPLARRRLRDARLRAGLSLRELGRRLGVSASFLSQIEGGKSDPSVSTLYALVSELQLSLDALLEPDEAAAPERRPPESRTPTGSPIVRRDERRVLEMDSGVHWEVLAPGTESSVDALLTTYQPGGSSSSSGRLMTHPGVEYAYLVEGELVLQLAFETYLIRAGDSLSFPSSTPHLYRNEASVPARGVWYVVGREPWPARPGPTTASAGSGPSRGTALVEPMPVGDRRAEGAPISLPH